MYGQRIRELRVERGLSQAALGGLLHCDQRTVSRYETEQHDLNTAVIIALCHIFEVSADYLLGLEDEMGAKTYR